MADEIPKAPKRVPNLSPKYKKQRKLKKPLVSEVFNLFKKKSDTPLQTIERFITMNPKYNGVKMTYAGRLDPMAEGVLVVLAGEKNKERDAYTGLDKDYEFEFILGVETDTYDVLGKIVSHGKVPEINLKDVQKAVKKYVGTFEQAYPAYSSKVVDGVPLFDLARQGKIGEVTLPTHTVTAPRIEITGTRTISRDAFKAQIIKSIGFVKGDFRQEETIALWKEYLDGAAPEMLTVYKGELSCGSGFYVRQLVSDLGRDLGTKAVTTAILRTRVGEFKLVK